MISRMPSLFRLWNAVLPILRLLRPLVRSYVSVQLRRSLLSASGRKAQIMKLLHVDSGILGASSVSRRLSAAAVAQWRDQHPETTVVYRDLVSDPVDHLTGEFLAAKNTDPRQHSPAVRKALAVGEKMVDEFLAADVVVVGAPMYNFGIPSQLKAWIGCSGRQDLRLHRKRTSRLSRRKNGHSRVVARRLLRPGQPAKCRRSSGKVLERGLRLLRHQGCSLPPCRRPQCQPRAAAEGNRRGRERGRPTPRGLGRRP
jgi:NAD(P)H-dependent FMN reductase